MTVKRCRRYCSRACGRRDRALVSTARSQRPDPLEHDGLGPVHPGFFAGLPDLWDRLKNTLTNKPCVVAGHSLGAARASLFTGLMVPADHSPVRRLCFGEPRSGFPQSDREQSATPSGVARARGGELRLCRRQEVRAYG